MYPHTLPAIPPTIPLFGSRVRAGFPSPADDYVERRLNLHELLVPRPAATFYLRAGASCPAAGVRRGDVLVIDRSLPPMQGRPAVVVAGGRLRVAVLPTTGRLPEVWGMLTFIIHPINPRSGGLADVCAD